MVGLVESMLKLRGRGVGSWVRSSYIVEETKEWRRSRHPRRLRPGDAVDSSRRPTSSHKTGRYATDKVLVVGNTVRFTVGISA
jgi:hypothetical protein